jgi:hypothetical protein
VNKKSSNSFKLSNLDAVAKPLYLAGVTPRFPRDLSLGSASQSTSEGNETRAWAIAKGDLRLARLLTLAGDTRQKELNYSDSNQAQRTD